MPQCSFLILSLLMMPLLLIGISKLLDNIQFNLKWDWIKSIRKPVLGLATAMSICFSIYGYSLPDRTPNTKLITKCGKSTDTKISFNNKKNKSCFLI